MNIIPGINPEHPLTMWQFISTLIRPHKRRITVGLIALLLVNSLLLTTPIILGRVIDIFSSGTQSYAAIGWAWVLLAINTLIFFLRLCWQRFIILPSYKIERDVRKVLFKHIVSLCKKSLRDYDVGTQIALISRETSQLSDAISWGTVALVDGLFTIISVAIITLVLYPGIVWIALLVYPLTSITLYLVWKKTGTLYGKIQERIAKISELTRQMFTHIGDIKAHTGEVFYSARFVREGNKILSSQMRVATLEALLWPSALLVHGLAFVATLFLGIRNIQSGASTIGDLFAVMNYLTQIQIPFMGLGFALSIQQRGLSNARRINKLLHTPNSLPVTPHASVPPTIHGDLRLESVCFRYPKSESGIQPIPNDSPHNHHGTALSEKYFALQNISLSVRAGTWLGITGRIGCGKSTLAMLLARVYDANSGTVLWDGAPIQNYKLDVLRGSVLLQAQNFQLFSYSVLQNIVFTHHGVSGTAANEAQKYGALASLTEDIHTFPDGWNTPIGEAGIRLSGGQKQRVALARTLYAAPQVLIVDDVFAGLDNKTTKTIVDNLREIRKNKTTIIITHNLPVLSNTDRVLVMHEGAIIEDGTHNALIAKDTQYQSYWKEYLIEQGAYIV